MFTNQLDRVHGLVVSKARRISQASLTAEKVSL
jgi:hypothetical protein